MLKIAVRYRHTSQPPEWRPTDVGLLGAKKIVFFGMELNFDMKEGLQNKKKHKNNKKNQSLKKFYIRESFFLSPPPPLIFFSLLGQFSQ